MKAETNPTHPETKGNTEKDWNTLTREWLDVRQQINMLKERERELFRLRNTRYEKEQSAAQRREK